MKSGELSSRGLIDPRAAPLVALLVEDNPRDAEQIAIGLENAAERTDADRVQTIQCSTVAAARAILRKQPVDVVILDLPLPDARGLDTLRAVREASPQTPVIVLSDIGDQALALEALRAGAQDYILKPPPDGATLARIVRYAVERHHLMQTIDIAARESARAARQW